MAKLKADSFMKIEISWLKKYGYLSQVQQGVIEWTRRGSRISIASYPVKDEPHIQLGYVQTGDNGEPEQFNYRISLVTSPCNYGGYRWWFKCPLVSANGLCQRRVGTLYKVGNYFGCRYCRGLTYESRNQSHWQRIGGRTVSFAEVEALEKQVKRKFYKGQMTRAYRRFLLARQQCFRGMEVKFGAIQGRYGQTWNI